MTIYSLFITNKAGSLIYYYEYTGPGSRLEYEKTFSYPLEIVLKVQDERVVIAFGERDGMKCGHAINGINGIPTIASCPRKLEDGREVLDVLSKPENYPVAIRFCRSKLTANEKITSASTFCSLHAIAATLSPVSNSGGINELVTDAFRLACVQMATGTKLVCIAAAGADRQPTPTSTQLDSLLKRTYELYTDYALKNPFYCLDMPIRCDQFDSSLAQLIDIFDRTGNVPNSAA